MLMNFWTRRMRDEDKGFTLIELMVVVLIIAILIAIAIPTFLGARRRAQDRAAQSSLRNALTNAKAIFTDSEDYNDASAAALSSAEPSLSFYTNTDSDGPTAVSIFSASAQPDEWSAATLSNSGTCWWIKDSALGPGTTYGETDDDTACSGSDADAAAAGEW